MGAGSSTQAASALVAQAEPSMASTPPAECPMHNKQGEDKGGTANLKVSMQGVGGGVQQCPMREGAAPSEPQGWVSECPAAAEQNQGKTMPADFDPRNMVSIN